MAMAKAILCSNELKPTPEDMYLSRLLGDVFPGHNRSHVATRDSIKPLNLSNLSEYLDSTLDEAIRINPACREISDESKCRIGPSDVTFDISSNVGTIIVQPDRLGIYGFGNFSTLRANCCVFRGKWVYELMLGSKGVMQVGWSSLDCKFTNENGVGDTPNSYSYDGSRVRKWNVTTEKYGEPWLTGNIISCAIDCNEKTVSFYRNGKSMGTAFNDIRTGPGLAYFPGISLSKSENLRANFGATPLIFPIAGYRPLQDPPQVDLVKAQLAFGCLDRLFPFLMDDEQIDEAKSGLSLYDNHVEPLAETRSSACTCLLVAANVFDKLAPLLKCSYIVTSCLVKFCLSFCDPTTHLVREAVVTRLLDLIWALLQDFEIKTCLESLMLTLLSGYRFLPVNTHFKTTKQYLSLTLAIMRHQKTRHYLLSSVLFDKINFPIILYIKPLDESALAEIFPTVWWESYDQNGEPLSTVGASDEIKMKAYMRSCEKLQKQVDEIEEIHIEILKVLLQNDAIGEQRSCRSIFVEKLMTFLKENTAQHPVSNMCPPPVMLSFFHRLLTALRHHWDAEQDNMADNTASNDAFVPLGTFCSDRDDKLASHRIGGRLLYLQRILGESMKDEIKACCEAPLPSSDDLIDILNGVIVMYHAAAHKQLEMMSDVRDNMKEFVLSFQDCQSKQERCTDEMDNIRPELERSLEVFEEKLIELSRQNGWMRAVVCSKSKRDDVAWLLSVLLKTIEKASFYGRLMQYLPEYYVETCINSCFALRRLFHPTQPFESVDDYDELIRQFADFLTKHFADIRIANSDVRDNIIQALTQLIANPPTLCVLESQPIERQERMIHSLILPYENRLWAQTNWILLRIWKGCGFGFRYTTLPSRLLPRKVQPSHIYSVRKQKPCPSKIFQQRFSDILLRDSEKATRFLDTLLKQLNWAFSEFIGMMQEVQQTSTPVYERQVMVCGTCFEVMIHLLRVLEMVVTLTPSLFTDNARPSAELLLGRLVQLLCQILTRVTSRNGSFEIVTSLHIAGLESICHYPILSAVVGILIQLLLKSHGVRQEHVVYAVLSEPAFQITSLDYLMGQNSAADSFSLSNCSEVNQEERDEVARLITFIRTNQSSFIDNSQDLNDEDICTICYANPFSAIFEPCGHQSCRKCISHHLMNKSECFFCKGIITAVHDLSGQPINLQLKSTFNA